jgi:hypothetical protein
MLERLEHLSDIFYWRVSALQHNDLKAPHDMGQAVRFMSDGEGLIEHFVWIILLAYMGVLLVRYAGLRGESFILLIIACGTGVILTAMVMILQQRASVAMKIRGCTADSCTGTGRISPGIADQRPKYFQPSKGLPPVFPDDGITLFVASCFLHISNVFLNFRLKTIHSAIYWTKVQLSLLR